MTDKAILYQAILKAKRNGWDTERLIFDEDILFNDATTIEITLRLFIGESKSQPFIIIFRHDFAKAFWGEKKEVEIGTEWFGDELNGDYEPIIFSDEIWKHHLQQMVISEDPIKYLEKFL